MPYLCKDKTELGQLPCCTSRMLLRGFRRQNTAFCNIWGFTGAGQQLSPVGQTQHRKQMSESELEWMAVT